MRTLLIGILAASAAWSQEDLDGRVRGLVAQLSNDSVETREEAAAALVALGEPAVGPLKQVILRSADGEVRGRIQGAIDRIAADAHRRKFKGGTPVDGLAARLEATKDKAAEEYVLKVEIMNVGPRPRSLVLVQRWNVSFPDSSRMSGGSEAEVKIEQLTGERSTAKSCTIG